MITEKTLKKTGFVKDNKNLKLKETFKDNIVFKEVYIDIYSENPLTTSSSPFMLLLRVVENKVVVKNDSNRLIFKKNIDEWDMTFVNVLFAKITECCYKCSDNVFEFILNIQNIYYRITICN